MRRVYDIDMLLPAQENTDNYGAIHSTPSLIQNDAVLCGVKVDLNAVVLAQLARYSA